MAKTKDLYSVLGVSQHASEDEIKKAYRKLARESHPDLHPGDKKAEERFKEISVANEILSNAEKRKLYDEFGAESLRPGFDANVARAIKEGRFTGGNPFAGGNPFGGGVYAQGAENLDINAIFEQMFGGGRGGGAGFGGFGGFGGQRRGYRAAPTPGENVEQILRVELEDALKGGELPLLYTKPSGENTTLKVKVPAGVDDGDRIRLAGQGHPGQHGGPAGDLILNIEISPHKLYKRQGRDLSLDLPITFPEAVLGAQVEVPTPEGSSVRLKLPPGAQSGKRLRIPGKGLPDRKQGTRGDFFVVLQIQTPDTQSPALKEIAESLVPLYGDVRKGITDPSR